MFVELYLWHKCARSGNFCLITHFEGKLLVIQIQQTLNNITPSLVSFWFQLIQVLLQTPMIIDGLRRCSDLEENQTRKPGKPWVTFLIIANLIMYLWETLEVKNPDVYKEQKQYYGNEFWIIISHVTLPLCIFYRFHFSKRSGQFCLSIEHIEVWGRWFCYGLEYVDLIGKTPFPRLP